MIWILILLATPCFSMEGDYEAFKKKRPPRLYIKPLPALENKPEILSYNLNIYDYEPQSAQPWRRKYYYKEPQSAGHKRRHSALDEKIKYYNPIQIESKANRVFSTIDIKDKDREDIYKEQNFSQYCSQNVCYEKEINLEEKNHKDYTSEVSININNGMDVYKAEYSKEGKSPYRPRKKDNIYKVKEEESVNEESGSKISKENKKPRDISLRIDKKIEKQQTLGEFLIPTKDILNILQEEALSAYRNQKKWDKLDSLIDLVGLSALPFGSVASIFSENPSIVLGTQITVVSWSILSGFIKGMKHLAGKSLENARAEYKKLKEDRTKKTDLEKIL